MHPFPSAPFSGLRRLALILPLLAVACATPGTDVAVPPVDAAPEPVAPQTPVAQTREAPEPASLQSPDETPWLYEGSNVPVDREWRFGELDNGLRYATRRNGVPPDQVSIRIRLDVGSLHEQDSEQGYAHLLEHLLFRQSRHLGVGEAIPTWQRLGATFGSDTNALTSPTQTVYQLDLPEADPAKLDEAFRLLSGMVQEPIITQANLQAEVPIVLAEKRERGGPTARVADVSRETLFNGQRLATRSPIGKEETLLAAQAEAVDAFHKRWYRPQETVIAVAGDADPVQLARLIEKYFGDWQVAGRGAVDPDFGDPQAPAGTDPANPVGETSVMVEPDLPPSVTYAIMRDWNPVQDTIHMPPVKTFHDAGGYYATLAHELIHWAGHESRLRQGGGPVIHTGVGYLHPHELAHHGLELVDGL